MRRVFYYIMRNINALNIFLLAVILVFIQYIDKPRVNLKTRYEIPKISEESLKNDNKAKTQESLNVDYMIIAAENPFHPERIISIEKKEQPPPPKPELLLYGVTITDDFSIAYVEDKKSPLTTPGRGKRHKVLKKGDSIGGFVLNEIYPDKIVLTRGEESLVVNLTDSTKPRDGAVSPPSTVQKPAAPPSRPVIAPNPQPIP